MKICTVCQTTYSDDMMRCYKCGRFLIQDLSSNLNNRSNSFRTTFTRRTETEGNTISEYPHQTESRNSLTLTPGERIDSSNTDMSEPIGQYQGSNTGVGFGLHRRGGISRFFIRITPYLRYFIPSVLILIAIFFIVKNWAVIKPVLTCIGVGAVVGGALAIYITRRHFHPNVITAGAAIGSILACVFQYNILDIGTEIGELIYALGPVFIILLGIGYILKSIFK